jgi:GTP cyclohydrolase IA
MATDETFFDPSDLFDATDAWSLAQRERVEDLTRSLIDVLGEDVDRPGLERTPQRVARAWEFLTAGYRQSGADVINGALFPAEGAGLVLVHDISFASLCEHHLLPFFGRVHIAYEPSESIVGLSKLARVTDVYSRRLQVQERLTREIADALMDVLQPLGVGVIVEAEHMCMRMRGVEKPGALTTTMSMLGSFREDPAVRDEFLSSVTRRR